MILVDAVYINTSGGKVLIELLIDSIAARKLEEEFVFLFDARIKIKNLNKLNGNKCFYLKSSEITRRKFYKNSPLKFKSVFCFANVPPPVSMSVEHIYIFFQNSLLLNSKGMNYSIFGIFSFYIKRLYIKFLNKNKYNWVVQTPTMLDLVKKKLKVSENKIKIIPFFQNKAWLKCNKQLNENRSKFLYVADGVNQKNHFRLFSAWEAISEKTGLNLELHLTIPDKYHLLISLIDKLKMKGYLIFNHGICDNDKLLELYSNCNYFIFPSLTESFGLPLVEASSAGCEVIASELPYVHDIVTPLQTFNPWSIDSIVDVVIGVTNNPNMRGTKIKVENQIENLIDLITKYNV